MKELTTEQLEFIIEEVIKHRQEVFDKILDVDTKDIRIDNTKKETCTRVGTYGCACEACSEKIQEFVFKLTDEEKDYIEEVMEKFDEKFQKELYDTMEYDNKIELYGKVKSFIKNALQEQERRIRKTLQENLDKHCVYEIGVDSLLSED